MGEVSRALIAALAPNEPLSTSALEALVRFAARKCFWRIESFDWRVVHRTYHTCVAERDGQKFVALIGADAPIIALAHFRDDLDWTFFDDPSVEPAIGSYYGQKLLVLSANDLQSDLTTCDRLWLERLGEGMQYDLQYWNPRTVGQVVFNFWD